MRIAYLSSDQQVASASIPWPFDCGRKHSKAGWLDMVAPGPIPISIIGRPGHRLFSATEREHLSLTRSFLDLLSLAHALVENMPIQSFDQIPQRPSLCILPAKRIDSRHLLSRFHSCNRIPPMSKNLCIPLHILLLFSSQQLAQLFEKPLIPF
jgi:hypothetical protein